MHWYGMTTQMAMHQQTHTQTDNKYDIVHQNTDVQTDEKHDNDSANKHTDGLPNPGSTA